MAKGIAVGVVGVPVPEPGVSGVALGLVDALPPPHPDRSMADMNRLRTKVRSDGREAELRAIMFGLSEGQKNGHSCG